jgi:hypothetical protein
MPKLFYDDEFDALAQTIANSEKTFKQCAAYLFPDRKPETAYARLKACLSAEKDERLTLGQIVALCRFCASYDALYFLADELEHERPAKRAPEDELAVLIRQYLECKKQGSTLEPRIEERMAKLVRAA